MAFSHVQTQIINIYKIRWRTIESDTQHGLLASTHVHTHTHKKRERKKRRIDILEFQNYLQLHNESEASLGYVRPCFKKINTKKKHFRELRDESPSLTHAYHANLGEMPTPTYVGIIIIAWGGGQVPRQCVAKKGLELLSLLPLPPPYNLFFNSSLIHSIPIKVLGNKPVALTACLTF